MLPAVLAPVLSPTEKKAKTTDLIPGKRKNKIIKKNYNNLAASPANFSNINNIS